MDKVTFSVAFLFLVFKCNGQITSSLQDEIKCTGESVTLNWAYNTANELVATWLFGTSAIMTGVSGGTPTVDNAYSGRATHGGNGVLTLTGLTTADSGTYSLSITYGASPGTASDSVQVTVYDKISQESTPVCGTNTVTCGSSLLSGVTYSWTVDGAATSDTSWSITTKGGTKTYACTISGDRVTNCLNAGIATTKSASCTFEESGGLSPCAIFGIVIAVVEVIAAVVLAILWWRKLLCFKEPKLIGYDKAGIVIAVLVGVVVIPAVVIVILWKKKLLCFKGNKLGDLVWAKLERYPWWPGLVCNHPTELTHQKSQKNPQIHVQFFDDPPSRAWIKAKNVKEFKGSDHADFKKGGLFFSLSEDIQKGAKEADEALKLTKERRLKLLVALQPYDDKNMEFHGYKLGDLVWAKLEGYPWWPSLICNRPTELTHQNSRENPQIHVQFFDDPQSRAWIKAKNVREFKGSDHADFKKGGLFFSLDEDVQKGAKEADDALKLTKKGRLELVADMEFDDGTEKTIKTTNAPTVDSGNVTYSEVATTDPKLDIENKKRHNELDPLTVLSDRQTEINKKKPMPDIGQKSE